jgi:ABC-type multidrug transport system ATPase subunit
MDTPAVAVHGLVKRYGVVEAVRGIDLEVVRGETFGFLGPNGAGKSTTINILCTLVEPTEGDARVVGLDVVRDRAAVRRRIGLVFQDPTLDGPMSGEQNLRFHQELYGVDRRRAPARREEVLRMVGLWERRADEVRTYSGGMRRRLEIARGLLHSPQVLFLDEPTIGLDPQTRGSIWDYVAELHRREEITVFVTTHYMDEAEHCDRIAIMNEGRIVALDTPDALKAQILVGKALGGASVATLQCLILLALAGLVGVPYDPLMLLAMVGLIFLMGFMITALGLLLAARVRQVQSAMPLVQLVITPLMFLSGALFPLSGLPTWLAVLTHVNPMTYAVEPLRSVVFDHLHADPATRARFDPGIVWGTWAVPVGVQILMTVGFCVLLLGLAVWRFRRTE